MELKNIISKFIGTDNCTVTQINNGLINTTYCVENNQNREKYILQKINTQVFKRPEQVINNHLKINKILKEGQYHFKMTQPIASSSEEFLIRDGNGDSWRMTSFIDNSITFLTVPSAETASKAARAVGYFLSIINTQSLPIIEDPLPDFLNFEKRLTDYKISLESGSSSLKENAKAEIEMMNQLLWLPDQWIKMQNNGQLPKRIVHADAKISNILFDQNHDPMAIIDLDTIMTSTILYDFGTMIQSYTNTTNEDDGTAQNNFNSEIFESVKEGFLFHLKDLLTPDEFENLDYSAQVAIYIQGLRFLTDYLNGSTYYSTTYPEHNLDRTKNQLELLRGLRSYLKVD
ncbi:MULTISPECIES: phosphotransferase enzyme family protein [Chryseobacterium]|uniref:phosphotransferase enzyme family protein n=1 Tax=Chryseobacterium TaxID=59732 RepID=UPI0023595FFA|nr:MULTISPECIES: aminoglycoside phosphotransferase family protein [unclassified Chryseobacterium]MDC8104661.1 aminoglycoside phosphotransferase family protein [Chryseobacterium sp. B21-037]MDQ1806201.1 aminoglycoside phosphotransferase family protein [Chryseobacterium sp. CKR4-1]WBV58171.1 aminoglycoside phosphotransferase family protein [Chryseobacterium daecheongense]